MSVHDQIMAYQTKRGLKVDGVPGPATWADICKLAGVAEASADPTTAVRHINDRGIELVKHFESLFLKAYQDIVGVWTIGWGHTGLQHKDGTVFAGRMITRDKAEELLRYDMHQFEARVQTFVKVAINDDQFAALVSFDFNTGGLAKSTTLRKLNAGDNQGAADALLMWNKANGKVVRGLTRRRESERNLFMGKTPFIVPS